MTLYKVGSVIGPYGSENQNDHPSGVQRCLILNLTTVWVTVCDIHYKFHLLLAANKLNKLWRMPWAILYITSWSTLFSDLLKAQKHIACIKKMYVADWINLQTIESNVITGLVKS
jgi:hypothetical protein